VKDYVKDYFDRHAAEWVEAAYVGEVKFPVGGERVRLAIEGVAPAMSDGAGLVDLGCGGGQLAVHAARLGWRPVGVDVAPSMIDEARAAGEGLAIDWVVAAYDESGLSDADFSAVTAMGLIEYLEDDDGLFHEARRLLRAGGRFAVSCRNRLYNLLSVNDYTSESLAADAPVLLDELRDELSRATDDEVHALAYALADSADDLRAAADADRAEPPREYHDHVRAFVRGRKQHTPREINDVAQRHDFRHVETLALHPHPLPPGLEAIAPRAYNALALAYQRPLERSPIGLAFCTAFVAVYEAD
jgi:SAM-dependent methyltransferase